MKKSIILTLTLLNLVSCASIRNAVNFKDPYTKPKISVYKTKKEVKQDVSSENKMVERNIVENKLEDFYKVDFTSTETHILERFKKDYNLVENQLEIERKTKDAIIRIRVKEKENKDALNIIKEINEILKQTKTRSYTFAITRLLNNWGI